MERTLAILKPDTVAKGNAGKVIARLEAAGFRIVAMKKITLSTRGAEEFYAVHRGKHFYAELVAFMSSGPCIPLVLEKDAAVDAFRTLIGPTNPAEAAAGTIRAEFATSTTQNAVHGSDSPANAALEIQFFFSKEEIIRST